MARTSTVILLATSVPVDKAGLELLSGLSIDDHGRVVCPPRIMIYRRRRVHATRLSRQEFVDLKVDGQGMVVEDLHLDRCSFVMCDLGADDPDLNRVVRNVTVSRCVFNGCDVKGVYFDEVTVSWRRWPTARSTRWWRSRPSGRHSFRTYSRIWRSCGSWALPSSGPGVLEAPPFPPPPADRPFGGASHDGADVDRAEARRHRHHAELVRTVSPAAHSMITRQDSPEVSRSSGAVQGVFGGVGQQGRDGVGRQ
ncbi:hypothetical protein [Nonomuraea helvata]|uniref:Uncharacterized protein n=1 Tax=Nonomuraea helvata TaxID=37484 RepID=A0ABV5S3A7_9ACTN